MKLIDLAISSWVFSQVADYNNSYGELIRATGRGVDLGDEGHRLLLLQWLNKWGCRQFAIDHHPAAAERILFWHKNHHQELPSQTTVLESLSDEDISRSAKAYEALAAELASVREGNIQVTIGPTGAAKILFALRPHALPPWDDPIRKTMGWNGSGESFIRFLKHARALASDLAEEASRLGFTLADFPARVNRPNTTVPKLIDEYFWVTITRGVTPPDAALLREWLTLA